MSTRIGRLVFDDRPTVYQVGTDEVTVSGVVVCDSVGKADHYRQQIVDLASARSEGVIPIVVEDGFAGFVRVTRSTAEAEGGSMGIGHWFRYSITATPVLGSGLPVVESIVTGAVRANGHGIAAADAQPFHAAPATPTFHAWGDPADGQFQRQVEGGEVSIRYETSVYSGVASWSVEPADYLTGACGVEELVDGEYLPHTASGSSLSSAWRLSNGLVRFSATEGSGDLSFQWYDGSNWSSSITFYTYLDNVVGGPLEVWQATVVRLSAEVASVVLTTQNPSRSPSAYAIVASIRRGSQAVTLSVSPTNNMAGFSAAIVEFVTDNTLSVPANPRAVWPSDVDGWRPVFFSPNTITASSPPGFDPGFSDYPVIIGVSAYNSALTTAQMSSATEAQDEWFAAQSERTVIGNRL